MRRMKSCSASRETGGGADGKGRHEQFHALLDDLQNLSRLTSAALRLRRRRRRTNEPAQAWPTDASPCGARCFRFEKTMRWQRPSASGAACEGTKVYYHALRSRSANRVWREIPCFSDIRGIVLFWLVVIAMYSLPEALRRPPLLVRAHDSSVTGMTFIFLRGFIRVRLRFCRQRDARHGGARPRGARTVFQG